MTSTGNQTNYIESNRIGSSINNVKTLLRVDNHVVSKTTTPQIDNFTICGITYF